MKHYILVGQTPVPINCDLDTENGLHNLRIWGMCFDSDRQVAAQRFFNLVSVSTVFLGIDHRWGGGAPLLFESMAFWWGEGEDCMRCSTWLEAELQHRVMCAEVIKPRAVWDAICRLWHRTWRAAIADLREAVTGGDDAVTE